MKSRPRQRSYPSFWYIRADQLGRSLSQIINHSYNVWSPIDFWSKYRGWNYFEMACARLADKAKIQYFLWDDEDVQKGASNLQSIAICLLILYMFVAEIHNSMNRRKTNNKKGENYSADEQPSSKTKKKKIQWMKARQPDTRCNTSGIKICTLFNNFILPASSDAV
jgi:hypothetical protein